MKEFIDNFGEQYSKTLIPLDICIAKVLSFFGVQRIYGIGGDYITLLAETLGEKFELLPATNETHAGYAACAEAELGKLGVCLTTYCVGSLPTLSAAALAKAEQLPVVFISGAPGEDETNNTALHHTIHSPDHWNINFDGALDAFSALGIHAERLQGSRGSGQPSIAGENFFQLCQRAYLKKEPVFVEIPRDLVQMKTQPLNLSKGKNNDSYSLCGADLIANEIKNRLELVKYPVVFFGSRLRHNTKLLEYLHCFCETLKIPYMTNIFAKGIFDEFNPLNLGHYNGVFSNPDAKYYLDKKADFVLEICTGILTQDTSSALLTGTDRIANFPNKISLKGTVPNSVDIEAVFKLLLQMKHPVFTIDMKPKSLEKVRDDEPVSFKNLASILNHEQSNFDESFIYLPEIGNSYFASFDLITKKSSVGRSWLANPWFAAMGTSLPYARAVSHALRSKNSTDIPIVITGDGGFGFQNNELAHFQQDELFIVILYMRNNTFHLGKNGEGTIYQCVSEQFNVQLLVEAYGGKGRYCPTVAKLKTALHEASLAKKGIWLLEIPVSTDAKKQSHTINLLNLYIRARSGDKEALNKWKSISK